MVKTRLGGLRFVRTSDCQAAEAAAWAQTAMPPYTMLYKATWLLQLPSAYTSHHSWGSSRIPILFQQGRDFPIQRQEVEKTEMAILTREIKNCINCNELDKPPQLLNVMRTGFSHRDVPRWQLQPWRDRFVVFQIHASAIICLPAAYGEQSHFTRDSQTDKTNVQLLYNFMRWLFKNTIAYLKIYSKQNKSKRSAIECHICPNKITAPIRVRPWVR